MTSSTGGMGLLALWTRSLPRMIRPRIEVAPEPENGRPDLPTRVEDYLRAYHVLSLATVGHRPEELAEELLPHAATVFYAADRSLRLICLSREGRCVIWLSFASGCSVWRLQTIPPVCSDVRSWTLIRGF